MMKDNNYIDELFDKELGAYEMGTASQGWTAVAKGLAKKGIFAFIKSSIWLKLIAGIGSVGLVTFLTIITINPYFVSNKQAEIINFEPTITNDNPSLASHQTPISQIPISNTNSSNQTKELNQNISSKSILDTEQENTHLIINDQAITGNSLIAKKSNDIESIHSTDNELNISETKLSDKSKLQSKNIESSTLLAENVSNENVKSLNTNINDEQVLPSEIDSDDKIDINSTSEQIQLDKIIASNNVDQINLESNTKSSELPEIQQEVFQPESKTEFPIIATKDENEIPVNVNTDEIIDNKTNQDQKPLTKDIAPNNPEINKIASNNITNEEIDLPIDNKTSEPNIEITPDLNINNLTSTKTAESEILANVEIPDSQPEELQPNVSIRLDYELLTMIKSMPLEGIVPSSNGLPQTNDMTLNFVSPSRQFNGYNPLSWALSGWYAPQVLKLNTSTLNSEIEPLMPYLDSGMENPNSFNAGIRIEARTKNLLFETGLGLMQINQIINYQTTDYSFINYTLSTPWDTTIYNEVIDSVITIIGIDTTWNTYTQIDSTQLFDTIYTAIQDTSKIEKEYSFSNTYKYIEVPLIVGYSFNSGRLTTTVKGGVITSFLWKAHARSLTSESRESIYTISRDKFPATRFDLYTGLEARYLLGSRFFVFGEAFYRQSINPIVVTNNISYHVNSYGLKLGTGLYF